MCMEKNTLELLKICVSIFGVCFYVALMGCNVLTLISISDTPKTPSDLRNAVNLSALEKDILTCLKKGSIFYWQIIGTLSVSPSVKKASN